MRQIGSFDNEQVAQRFTDYLLTLKITAVSENEEGKWAIWVRDENHLNDAREAFAEFSLDPNNAKFTSAAEKANEIRIAEQKRREQAAKNRVKFRDQWNRPATEKAPLTTGVVVICVLLFLGLSFGADTVLTKYLGLFDVELYRQTGDNWANIKAGQFWRIITPNFLHRDPIHLAFNMIMFFRFSSQVEARRSRWFWGMLVLFLAFTTMFGELAASSLGQVLPSGAPGFIRKLFGVYFPIGLSGVVYGLFGYIWITSRLDTSSGFFMSDRTVMFLLIFYVVCFTGILGPIANWGHSGGLFGGIACAYFLASPLMKR